MACPAALRVACLALGIAGAGTAWADEAVEARLQVAEAARGAAPERLAAVLAELDLRRGDATPAQRERIDLLAAERLGAWEGRPDDAAARAIVVFDRARDEALKVQAGAVAIANLGASRRFSEALRLLGDVLARRSRVPVPVRHEALWTAADLYNRLGQFALGLRYADSVLAADPAPRARCRASAAQLQAREALGALPRDNGPLRAAIEQCLAAGEAQAAHAIRITQARKLAADGRGADAIELLRLRLPDMAASGNHALANEAHALLAELALASGDAALARTHAGRVVASEAAADPRLLAVAHRTLHALSSAAGAHGEALAHYRRFAEAERSHLDFVRTRTLAHEVAMHEGRLQLQEIALLDQENRALALRSQYARQAQQRNLLVAALLLSLIVSLVAWALHVARRHRALRAFAETDGLTGVANRRHFMALAEACVAASARSGQPAAFVVLDLDHFKRVNDRLGHQAGDRVLARVAEACRGAVGPGGHVGRLGGEEFAFVRAACDRREAAQLADRCRIAIAEMLASDGDDAPDLAASFGVTDTDASGHDLAAVHADADRALYSAKHDGRNRVCIHVPAAAAAAAVVRPDEAAGHPRGPATSGAVVATSTPA